MYTKVDNWWAKPKVENSFSPIATALANIKTKSVHQALKLDYSRAITGDGGGALRVLCCIL